MLNYKDILKNEEIQKIYNDIEEKTHYILSHGIKHISNVVDYCKQIANAINMKENEKNLLLIAASLHDIGRNFAPTNHHSAGLEFIKKFLNNKLTEKEINTICAAIFYHDRKSCDFNKMDDIAYCLILADKLDYSCSRLIPELIDNSPKIKFYESIKRIDVLNIKNVLQIKFHLSDDCFKKDIASFMEGNNDILDNFVKHFNLLSWQYDTENILQYKKI